MVAAAAPVASAQATCGDTDAVTATCSPTTSNITVTVLTIVRLTVTPTDAGLTAPTDADFTAGGTATLTNLNLQALLVRANETWELTAVAGVANEWDPAPWTKPVADAAWSINGTNFFAFTGGSDAITTGSPTAGQTVNFSYEVDWNLVDDVPGAYTLPVTFTISST
jgi:hypothetical protein